MAAPQNSPPASSSPSPASKGTETPLSLDLKSVPPLIQPSPPSNTLIITVRLSKSLPYFAHSSINAIWPNQNLLDPSIFDPSFLSSLRNLLISHSPNGLHAFSPLRSMRRIILSLYTTDDAITLRTLLDGIPILSSVPRIYFGEPTPLQILDKDRFLAAPKSEKMFFISPPPSPPVGWEMRDEEPPNRAVHAEDLASALGRLSERKEKDREVDGLDQGEGKSTGRKRSGSGLVVYEPAAHGAEEGLPAVMVEDTSGDGGEGSDAEEEGGGKVFAHTARPSVELME